MEELEFKLQGPILENGVPIHIAIEALADFQSILDKTYLVAAGLQRMSSKERKCFQLRARNFKISSFVTDLEICLCGVQLVLPFVSALGPQNVWEYTKETFKFLKLVCTASHSGQTPTYEFHENKDFTVHIGDIHQHFHAPVFQVGEKSLLTYRDLAHLLERGRIESISAGSRENPEISLSVEDRTLFDLPTELQPDAMPVQCEIFDFNKFKNNGRLRVGDGQPIPPGDYGFTIFGTQDNVDYIYSMLKPSITINCLIETAINPFGTEKIAQLHITGISA